jgi:hypothetical protein
VTAWINFLFSVNTRKNMESVDDMKADETTMKYQYSLLKARYGIDCDD